MLANLHCLMLRSSVSTEVPLNVHGHKVQSMAEPKSNFIPFLFPSKVFQRTSVAVTLQLPNALEVSALYTYVSVVFNLAFVLSCCV